MVNLYIQKLDGNGNTLALYSVNNIRGEFGIEHDTPVSPMPLPQNNDTQNVLIKLEGNSSSYGIGFVMKDRPSSVPVNPAVAYTGFVAVSSIDSSALPLTIWQQELFFERFMLPVQVTDRYQITVCDSITLGSISNGVYTPTLNGVVYQKQGTFTKEKFSMAENENLIFTANLTFMTGNVVSAYELNVPSDPQNIVLTTPSSGVITTTFSAPTDTAGGITGYYIQRRVGLQVQPNTVADTAIGVIPNTTGATSYTYYVVAKNGTGQLICSIGKTITNGNASANNTITWNAVDGATSYDILRGDTSHSIALSQTGLSYTDVAGSTSAYTLTASQTAFKNTGLTTGTTYYYTVSARNSQGIGTPSNEFYVAAT